MIYRVLIQPPARLDIEAAYAFLRGYSVRVAERWLTGLETAIESLARMPNRCGIARESANFNEPIRQLLYGRPTNVYRVLFVVRDHVVRVLHVRHGARRTMKPEEIDW